LKPFLSHEELEQLRAIWSNGAMRLEENSQVNRKPIIHMLRKALGVLGSREELAQYLRVSMEDLSRWLNGESVPPPRPYLDAIDLVESGRRQARQEYTARRRK
jgi:DNA-binding transcriptional regulator YiaG